MRVLAPPSESARGALAYSFQQEEALALQASGHELYVVGSHGLDRELGGLQVRVLPPSGNWRARTGTARFLLRLALIYRRRMGLRAWARSFHLARVERFAAKLVASERLALVHSHFAWPEEVLRGPAVSAVPSAQEPHV